MVLSIDTIFPVTGQRGESTLVTALGEDFTAGANVIIGSTNAPSVAVRSGTELRFSTPPTLPPGKYDVTVQVGPQEITLRNSFIVTNSQPRYPFSEEDFGTIQSRMLQRLPEEYDTTQGTTIYDLYGPIALEIAQIYLNIGIIHSFAFVLTARGSYLDFRGIEYNVTRLNATPAVGRITFAGTGEITILAGTQVQNVPIVGSDPVIFETDEDVTLSLAMGEQAVLSVGSYTAAQGISSVNIDDAGGGYDPTNPPLVRVLGTNISPASLSVTVDANGEVDAVTINEAGSGYALGAVIEIDPPTEVYTAEVGITGLLIEDELSVFNFRQLGARTNLPANTITNLVRPILGVNTVTNLQQTRGGSDTEEDEQYRARILIEILTPSGPGNIQDYIRWAREANQYVGKVGVDPLRESERYGIPLNGTVGVYILNVDGGAAESDLIEAVQNYIAPLRDDVNGVIRINVLTHGDGYSNPPVVTIADPTIGVTATARTVISTTGQVLAVLMLENGTGYDPNNPPIVTIADPTTGTTATAEAIVGNPPSPFGNGIAPIGASPIVMSPEEVTAIIVVEIVLAFGFNDVQGEVSEPLQETIEQFISDLDIGVDVGYFALGRRMSESPGVAELNTYTLNGGVNNVVINNHQKAVTDESQITITVGI